MKPKFSLFIIDGPEAGKLFSFEKDSVNIGRTSVDNDLILNDQSISSQHARIAREGRRFFLQDLGSTNLTYYKEVSLEKNEKIRIQNGDEFTLGGVILRFIEFGVESSKCSLTMIKGTDKGKTFNFEKEVVNIGRAGANNDLILTEPSISSQHARIFFKGGQFFLEDLGSTNLTYYKKRHLKEGRQILIQNGDEFSLGEQVTFKFKVDAAVLDQTFIPKTKVLPRLAGDGKTVVSSGSVLKRKMPILIMGGGILLLLIGLGVLFYFQSHKQALMPSIPLPASATYGYQKKGVKTHPQKVIFTFITETDNLDLYYTAGGIDSEGEVVIYLNKTIIGKAPVAVDQWGQEQKLHLPDGLIIKHAENELVFENTVNVSISKDWETWSVKNVHIKFFELR